MEDTDSAKKKNFQCSLSGGEASCAQGDCQPGCRAAAVEPVAGREGPELNAEHDRETWEGVAGWGVSLDELLRGNVTSTGESEPA